MSSSPGLESHLSTKFPKFQKQYCPGLDYHGHVWTLPPHGVPITTGSHGLTSHRPLLKPAKKLFSLSSSLTALPYGVVPLASSHQPGNTAVEVKGLQRGRWHRMRTESKLPQAGAAFCPGGRGHSCLVELTLKQGQARQEGSPGSEQPCPVSLTEQGDVP